MAKQKAVKLYQFDVNERNGEQTYSHRQYVLAYNLTQATRYARSYTRQWYEEGKKVKDEKDTWEVWWGASWSLGPIRLADPVWINDANSPSDVPRFARLELIPNEEEQKKINAAVEADIEQLFLS